MDKLSRARRIHFLTQCLPDYPTSEIGLYFGEHVIRVEGQLCLVVTLKGAVGIRATDPELESELHHVCGDQRWVAHGRVYGQWYLLPEAVIQNVPRLAAWARRAASGVIEPTRAQQSGLSSGR
jgi:hypothetical protein